ncbi:hypothetical protein N431DRAFT_83759 [Stipitochalara longipes BDJ]|nr:hypothetical protein N431DRAFT_83759 [Stipitochalara longipes BDJ]
MLKQRCLNIPFPFPIPIPFPFPFPFPHPLPCCKNTPRIPVAVRKKKSKREKVEYSLPVFFSSRAKSLARKRHSRKGSAPPAMHHCHRILERRKCCHMS